LLVTEGAKDIPLGTPVAIVVSKKEDIAAFENYSVSAAPSKPAPSTPAKQEPVKETPKPVAAV